MAEWDPELAELGEREALAERMGGEEKVTRQHERGKMDVRQRIDALVDEGSFHEIGNLADLVERPLVDQGIDALAHVHLAPFMLSGDLLLAAHPLSQRLPLAQFG